MDVYIRKSIPCFIGGVVYILMFCGGALMTDQSAIFAEITIIFLFLQTGLTCCQVEFLFGCNDA
jgi:hypothetical protein